MKNNHILPDIDPDKLKDIVRKQEPHLRDSEKIEIWEEIEKLTLNRKQRLIPLWSKYAAALIILLLSGVALLQWNRVNAPFLQMADLVQADTLKSLTLFIGDQRVELADNIDLTCLPETDQIEVSAYGKSLFKLSAPEGTRTYLQIAVPKGKKTNVYLADHSKVTVREGSKLTFPLAFEAKKRRIYLEGEAFMKVAHNPSKAFITETKDLNVSVLGTEFLVSAYRGESESSVLLVSGKVEVKPVDGAGTLLLPNQMYVYKKTTAQASVLPDVDPTTHLTWTDDILLMQEEPLNRILERIESIYRIRLIYNPKEMDNICINGKLDISVSADELLERLSRIAPIRYRQENGNRIIESDKNNK